MSKIIEFTSENVKRLSAVHITPEGDLIILSGENGEGKSSVIDSIWLALKGADAAEENPTPVSNRIKEGEQASVRIVTEDYIITRTWTDNDHSYLKVEANIDSESRPVYSKPQTLLDKFIGDLTFDPMEFIDDYDKKKQIDTLIRLSDLKINPLDIDEKVKLLKEERKDFNRDVDKFKKFLLELPEPEVNLPDNQVDLKALEREKDLINLQIRDHDKLVFKLRQSETQRLAILRDKTRIDDEIEKLKQRILQLQGQTEEINLAIENCDRAIGIESRAIETHQVGDIAQVDIKIAKAKEINQKIQVRENRVKLENARDEAFIKSEELTQKIQDLETTKITMLQEAKFPIQGLSYDETGPLFNKLPLSQASQAEKLRIGFAVGMALNPKLKVIMSKKASLLDKKNTKLIADLAKEHGYQFWLEKVEENVYPTIVIEDGAIKEIKKGGEKIGRSKREKRV